MKKRITALVLAVLMIFGVNAGAVTKTLREAGVADTLSENRRFTSQSGISWDSGGAFAATLPAQLTYSLYKGISYMFIVAEKGFLNESFTLELSPDGEIYNKKLTVPTELGLQGDTNVYYFNEIGAEENYLKINLLDKNVRIRSVYINTDLADPELRSLVKTAEKQEASAFMDRVITEEDLLKYKQTYISSYAQSKQDVSAYLNSLEPDGTWADVSYVGTNGVDNAETHLLRCTEIAKTLSTEGSLIYGDPKAVEKLALACNAMCDMNIKMSSWYNNQITIIRNVGMILLAAGDMLPEKTQEKLRGYIDSRISLAYSQPPSVYTGSNLIERQDAIIRYALYLNDTKLLKETLDPIINEMVMVTKIDANTNPGRVVSINGYSGFSGIQADYSLWFHGPQLYSSGYCLTMFKTIVQFIYDTQGTNIFPVETTKDFIDCIFEHYLWIMRGNTLDFNTIGRTIAMASSSCASGNANSVVSMIKKLSTIDGIYRQDDLIAMNNLINSKDYGSAQGGDAYIIRGVEVSSSQNEENNADNMIDDDYDTRWSAEGTEQYAIFDLGEVQKVGVVSVAFYSGVTRQTDFEIDLSSDGESWINVFDGMSGGTTNAPEYYTFFPWDAHYVRLRCHGNTKSLWNSVSEVKIYESIDTESAESEYTLQREEDGTKIYITRPVDKVARAYVSGSRYFWRSNYLISHQPNLMIALKMSSKKIIASEQISMLNLKGTYKSDGCTFLYRTTQEYDDIFGAWDWRMLPGTTTSLKEFNPPLVHDYRPSGSMSEYVGGVTNGRQAAAAMELVRDGVYAKKAWFVFDNEMLAMGTDLKNTTKADMVTTMNQCLLKGDVRVLSGGQETTLSRGTHKNKKADWVIQDKIGYFFPGGATVNIENDAVTGDRVDINWNASYTRPNKTDLVTKDIFKLWVNHSDTTAGEQEDYAYMVIPQVTEEAMNGYVKNNPVSIISNTGTLQAAEHKGLGITQCIFWQAGSVTDSDGITITADRPLLVQVQKLPDKLVIDVAGLTFEAGDTTLRINEILDGDGASVSGNESEIALKLPGGEYTGKTVSIELERVLSD